MRVEAVLAGLKASRLRMARVQAAVRRGRANLHSGVPAGTLALNRKNGMGEVLSHGVWALAVGFSGMPLAMQFAGTLIPNRIWNGVMVFCAPPSTLLLSNACGESGWQ